MRMSYNRRAGRCKGDSECDELHDRSRKRKNEIVNECREWGSKDGSRYMMQHQASKEKSDEPAASPVQK